MGGGGATDKQKNKPLIATGQNQWSDTCNGDPEGEEKREWAEEIRKR
jgi:hypothetical protein